MHLLIFVLHILLPQNLTATVKKKIFVEENFLELLISKILQINFSWISGWNPAENWKYSSIFCEDKKPPILQNLQK